MKRMMAAAALTAGGLLTLGLGVAHADEVQVEGNYATLEACQADGRRLRSRTTTTLTRFGIADRATTDSSTCT